MNKFGDFAVGAVIWGSIFILLGMADDWVVCVSMMLAGAVMLGVLRRRNGGGGV